MAGAAFTDDPLGANPIIAYDIRRQTFPRYPMPINILIEGDVVVLSNFSRLMNDPRYVDAGRDIQDVLEQGYQKFVLDLGNVRETGSSFLGLLMTITRRIQRRGGDVVLAHLSREVEELLETMQMEDFWDVFPTVKEAIESFQQDPESLNEPEDRPR
jgi:anti-anti-sigma factor